MRTAYIGSSGFAAAVLETLAGSPHRPLLVITRPPRPAGRGRHVAPTPVAAAAVALGIELAAPARLEDAAAALAQLAPEAICLCAYGALVREPLLSDYEILNVHPSLLPRWRGAAPIERAIIAGDELAGVSIMRLVAELDAGPICAQSSTVLGTEDFGALSDRLAEIASRLLVGALDGPRVWVEQPAEGVTYAEKITAADRVLDPARGAVELERVVRALHPHIGARLADGLGVLEARVSEQRAPLGGLVVRDGRLLYGARDSALELLIVKPPGGRAMDGASFVRGHAV
ncbi:MAG: methionyl-tRNA formyltransferase [Solirubrobacteraceae bacterium]